MGPFFVVLPQPDLGDILHLTQFVEYVQVQHLFAVGLVETFKERLLHGNSQLSAF